MSSGCGPAWSRSVHGARRGSSWSAGETRTRSPSARSRSTWARSRWRRRRAGPPGAEGDLLSARRQFEAALAYWRGEPFEDWRTAGWAEGERRRLADLQASILEARVDVDLDLGRHRELVAELEARIAADPLREGWWIRLMLALYRSDRQADALAAARRARVRLVEDLGVDPGPALARMEQAVLIQADDLLLPLPGPIDGAATGVPAPTRSVVTGCPYRGLAVYEPADADLFHGRSAAVRALTARLRATRLVVVSGPSGVGKSSVVRAGLVPELLRGCVPHSVGAEVMVIKPGPRPADELAPLLRGAEAEDSAEDEDSAEGRKQRGGRRQRGDPGWRRGPGAPRPDRRPVALVVDQFEQLWTAGADERSEPRSSTRCWRCSTTVCSVAPCSWSGATTSVGSPNTSSWPAAPPTGSSWCRR